jgi:glycine cleavage system H lipoate-binding protein
VQAACTDGETLETVLILPGWLCKVKMANPGEFEALLNAEAYKAHCEGN